MDRAGPGPAGCRRVAPCRRWKSASFGYSTTRGPSLFFTPYLFVIALQFLVFTLKRTMDPSPASASVPQKTLGNDSLLERREPRSQ